MIDDDGRSLWFRHDSFEGGIQFELIGSVRGVLCWRIQKAFVRPFRCSC